MGSSLSCPCASGESGKHVLVLKQNGKAMKVKEGTRVKEILASNPHHVILRCRSDQSLLVLPDSIELRSYGLYFMVEEGQQALDKDTFCSLMKLAHSRGIAGPKSRNHKKMPSACKTSIKDREDIGPQFNSGQIFALNECDIEYQKSSSWRPALRTIPELRSQEDLKASKEEEGNRWSMDKQDDKESIVNKRFKGAPFSPSTEKKRMKFISRIIHTFTIAATTPLISTAFE
ncbi:unnamed protein product [Dovyalis caffra]|uniref:Uncharacterized protein n=1 Tax=Dovyalis caffra TaxID=77055 RepID=A0AAV1QR39_9ROSI|nr:unnamed protein product [Dovyalis caffra]